MNYKKGLGPPIATIMFCVGIVYIGLELGLWVIKFL